MICRGLSCWARRKKAAAFVQQAISCVVWFLLSEPAMGVSLYDVVQLSRAGYTDQQIVDLIQATDSRFVLDARALVALKEAKVSETVIQALIKAKAPDAAGEGQAGGEASPSGSEHIRSDAAGHGGAPTRIGPSSDAESAPSAPAYSDPVGAQAGGMFSSYPLHESHSGPHQHFALSVRGVPMLILRGEQGHATIKQRAQHAAEQLNRLVVSPSGRFSATRGPVPGVWYRADTESPATEVLRVDRGDVIAYQHRSLGEVSAARLAAYWAALLNDYTQLFLFGRPATELVSLHQGKILRAIHAALDKPEPEEARPRSDAERLLGAVDHLEAEDKEHLLELTRRIPVEFQPR